MNDFAQRLAAADPAAGSPYEHPDVTKLAARIMGQPNAQPRQLWRRFQLIMASAVSVATLATLGGIAALESAVSSLPVLAIATTNPGAFKTATMPTNMRANAQYHFSVAPTVSAAVGGASAYRLSVASNARAEAIRIAQIFSPAGSATRVRRGPTKWVVTDSAKDALSYQLSGVARWTFTNGAVASVQPSGSNSVERTPDPPVAIAAARRYLGQLGYRYDVSAPVISWTSDPRLPVRLQPPVDRETITFNIRLNGAPTNQYAKFTFNPYGRLVSASGPAFGIGQSVAYPLQSPLTAVARLNAGQRDSTPSSGVASSAVKTEIALRSVALSLRSFQLTNGTTWLLPVYVFQSSGGGGEPSIWTTIAIDPSYVDQSSLAPTGLLPGGPINH